MEISKELLSEVLGHDVDKYKIVSSAEITQIRIWKKYAEIWDYRSYDIYHLAHKCKEWARSKKYFLETRILYPFDFYRCRVFSPVDKKWDKLIYNDECNKSDTEPEAIFKACEWILKEIKK